MMKSVFYRRIILSLVVDCLRRFLIVRFPDILSSVLYSLIIAFINLCIGADCACQF